MEEFSVSNISIMGISTCVPKNKAGIKEFEEQFGKENVLKFVKSTGIQSVHRALPEQTAGDLAYLAAQNLFKQLSVNKEDIGILVFVTQSPDYRRPATACILQNRLELPIQCAAFDVGLGCSGFVYGQQILTSLLQCSNAKLGLLLIGETASKLVNPHDKSIAMMYGDAGAAILYQKENGEKISTQLYTDGYRFKSIILPAGGFREMNPSHEEYLCRDGIKRSKYDIYMDGISVFTFSTSDVPRSIVKFLDDNNFIVKDFDKVILHQANNFIIKQIARRIKATSEQIHISLDRYGNTGGISIPLTLCDLYGASDEGDKKKILASGFGIGLSWGVTTFYVKPKNIFPIIESDECYLEGIINLLKI